MKTRVDSTRDTLYLALCGLLITQAPGCASTQKSNPTSDSSTRLYWKVYPKSDNTFYILPRPELTQALPTPEAINSLDQKQAAQMAAKLNSSLNFKIEVGVEGGMKIVRIVPEPLLEDVVEICKSAYVHPFLTQRCQKERAWAEKGMRPDIYLKMDECEAVALLNALNEMYQKKSTSSQLCPAFRQVEK